MTDYTSGQILFRIYGIEPDTLPDSMFEAEQYPHNHADHEAHDAATVVMDALKSTDRFEWADGITGVALGWEDDETDRKTALGVLEDLREDLGEDGMASEASTLNEAHYLLQEYGDEIGDGE